MATTSIADEPRVNIQAGVFGEVAILFLTYLQKQIGSVLPQAPCINCVSIKNVPNMNSVSKKSTTALFVLVFSSTGGAGPVATVFLKQFASRYQKLEVLHTP